MNGGSQDVAQVRRLMPAELLAVFGGDALRARIFHDKYALRDLHEQVREAKKAVIGPGDPAGVISP